MPIKISKSVSVVPATQRIVGSEVGLGVTAHLSMRWAFLFRTSMKGHFGMGRYRSETGSPYDVPRPVHRRLKIYSFDPSLSQRLDTADIHEARVEIPWESHPDNEHKDGPAPGPCGEYLEVIDYDPATGVYYEPVDINNPYLIAQDGLTPSDGNPQFHQQMVYAVAMRTIRNFEVALGRRALWAPHRSQDNAIGEQEEYVQRLRIYPHALREANAYYSPEKKALLFGYFQAAPLESTMQMTGGTVFTCLSHDVIAHETAHALLDGMHRRLIEPSNPDVLAFHEAFADIVALFQRFSIPDVVKHVIAKTRGDFGVDNLLADLAREFGQATGHTGALRSAIGKTPNPTDIGNTSEPHLRGSILVAAVFDAFVAIYRRRSEDLFRIATQGTGTLPKGAIHPDLVSRLSDEAAKTSQHVLTMCIRALDYLPPVDVTFGDYLRALITADYDLVPDDRRHYRVAFIEAFRRRGIFPSDVRSMSEESLRWQGPDPNAGYDDRQVYLGREIESILQGWNLDNDRHNIFKRMTQARTIAHGVIEQSKEYKQQITVGLDLERYPFEVHSMRPVRRTGPEGQFLMDMVVEITQRTHGFIDKPFNQRPEDLSDDNQPDFWFRGGCTLVVDLDTGRLRYCIYKDINSEKRYKRQQDFAGGVYTGQSLGSTNFGSEEHNEVFAILHRRYREGAPDETY